MQKLFFSTGLPSIPPSGLNLQAAATPETDTPKSGTVGKQSRIFLFLACFIVVQLLASAKLAADVVYINIGDVNTTNLDAVNSFDSIMRLIPPNSTIYIGPGVFPTRGVYNDPAYPNRGFRVKTGWTIIGSGKAGGYPPRREPLWYLPTH